MPAALVTPADEGAVENEQSRQLPEILTLVLAVILLLALGYSVAPVISPFVIIGALVFLLYPMRQSQFACRLLWLSVLVFLLWFFYSIIGILVPFIIAFLAAYMINPIVVKLQRRSIPRWASSLVSVVMLFGLVTAAILFFVPPAIRQFEDILAVASHIASEFSERLKSGEFLSVFARFGVSVEDAQEIISREISPRISDLLRTLLEGVFGFVSGFSSLVFHVINAVIIPFIMFYLLKDLPALSENTLALIPASKRDGVVNTLQKIDRIMGKYLRGAIIVAILQGCISGFVLWLLGVKYALVLGIMTGLLNFIPYVGLITSLVVSSLVAAFSGGAVLAKILGVVILYLSQKLLEATVLSPKIIGTQVGLHPVLLILCLLVFGYFLGFVGLLIAVPATALIMAGLNEWLAARPAEEPVKVDEVA